MLVEDYIALGLGLNKHLDGLVDAYYGPPGILEGIRKGPPRPPSQLVEDARELLAGIDSGIVLDENGRGTPARRSWLRAQVLGLLTTARKLAGVPIDYLSEVESCYGVPPRRVSRAEIEEARSLLESTFPGPGELRDRLSSYRESFAVPTGKLESILNDLADAFRSKTGSAFGLVPGEHVDFEVVKARPWTGFNYYLGNLRSRVAINSDLPVLSTSLAHLVAHEAYPGHHTEHTRKEVELVENRQQLEESIFLVGTPQCLIAEGLADFGLEILLGKEEFSLVAGLMAKRGINFPHQELEHTKSAFETIAKVRANVAWDLHQDGVSKEMAVATMERDALLSPARAQKSVEFLTDPTWRAYITCYVEGYQLVRSFIGNMESVPESVRTARFTRLITEQLTPADLSQDTNAALKSG